VLEAGLACEEVRQRDTPPDAYDGMLAAEAARAAVAARFSEEHLFSVSQIECWLGCPFQFFAERVLRIDETEAPEYGFDPQVRGSILHEALHTLMSAYAGRPVREIPLEEAAVAAESALNTAFDRLAWQARSARPGLRRVEQARMLRDLQRYVHTLSGEEQAWEARHFEVGFGLGEGAPPTQGTPFVLDTAAGPLRFSGRIDRMDALGERWRILDYKSGGLPTAREIKKGLHVQLAIYALAVEQHLLPGVRCEEALYVGLKQGKRQNALKVGRGETREDLLARVRDAVALAVRGIRAGRFAPAPQKEPCHGCGMARACRYQKARMLRKDVYNAVQMSCPEEGHEEEGAEE
jgi:ATP-dependent helicase/DNAse subunit B